MKIIVIGHGNFATGIHSSLKLIAGEQEKVDAIDFVEGMSANELKEKILAAITSDEEVFVRFEFSYVAGNRFCENDTFI